MQQITDSLLLQFSMWHNHYHYLALTFNDCSNQERYNKYMEALALKEGFKAEYKAREIQLSHLNKN